MGGLPPSRRGRRGAENRRQNKAVIEHAKDKHARSTHIIQAARAVDNTRAETKQKRPNDVPKQRTQHTPAF